MALTRITKGVIKPNENYDTHNIVSTGIVTAVGLDVNGNADISGNFSVGGVLTYEDVTSIDSVGIITAQKDIHVGAGVSAVGIVTAAAVDVDDFLDVGSIIKLGNAGVITATSFIGDGSGLIGVASTDNIITGTAATFNTYPVDINAGMTVAGVTTLGSTTNANTILASGYMTIDGNINITTGKFRVPDTIEHYGDSDTKIRFPSLDTITFETAGSERLRIASNGNTIVGAAVTISPVGNVNATGIITATSFFGFGTNGIKLPIGTTGQRVNTKATLRYNSTLELPEYYNGSEWIAIDTPPTVTSVSPTEVATASGGNITFTINGSRFSVGVNIKFVSNNGTELTPSSVTRVNGNQLTAVIAKNSFVNAQEPYDVKVINPSGLQATLADQINVDNDPAWVTSAGSLGSFNNYASVNVTVSATDADGDTVTYSIVSGSLPSGLSLNSSTGVISGTMGAVGSSTTANFTIRATANGKTADRAFSFVQAGPNTVAYSYTGSAQTFAVPSGLSSLTAYMWSGGGGGGGQHTGSGGKGQAGGAGAYSKAVIDVSSISNLYLVVGQGGQSGQVANNSNNVGGGCGGGLSGIFDNSNLAHSAAVLISGAGGGGSGDSNGQAGEGGGGGGANNNGRDGIPDERIGQRTQGLGGTTSAGGQPGNASSSSSYTHTNPTAGSALQGGNSGSQASGQSLRPSSYLGGGRSYIATNGNWMGGGGGSGYYGGGGGICGYAGGGGGGSGYAKGSVCSSIAAANGSDGSGQSTTAAPVNDSIHYASGVAQGGMPAADGGNGRIVLVY